MSETIAVCPFTISDTVREPFTLRVIDPKTQEETRVRVCIRALARLRVVDASRGVLLRTDAAQRTLCSLLRSGISLALADIRFTELSEKTLSPYREHILKTVQRTAGAHLTAMLGVSLTELSIRSCTAILSDQNTF